MTTEYFRFNWPAPVNRLPVLTFACHPGKARRHPECSGQTWWGGRCSCRCHQLATSQRAEVR